MRRHPGRTTAALALAALVLAVTTADADSLLRRYRLRRMSDATTMGSPPFTPDPNAPDCNPALPGVPDVIGAAFDPGKYDQIDLAGNGRLVAYASAVTLASPGRRAVVVQREGDVAQIVQEAAGDDDQPAIAFDSFGWRMAFRGSDAVAGQSGSNVWLHTVTRLGAEPGDETVNLTGLTTSGGLFARDPALAARTRVREIESGVTVRERDARVAFVSNGDLDKGRRSPDADIEGRNPDGHEQLFLWREQDARFEQLTRNDDADAAMSRPSISGDGRFVAFESDADLVPDAANPRDPAVVGNPGGVRQIYLWQEGRGLRQLTWGDEDSLAPRITQDGRFVFFCSRADLLPGGNPEGNFEIFRWRRGARPAARLAQLTQTTSGDSVLPRPLRNPRRFVFFSTAMPPNGGLPFGGGPRQCGPTALLWSGGRVRLVAGALDSENALLVATGHDPVLVGPPAAAYVTKVHFLTNDPLLDPPETEGQASLIRFHAARATRYPRR